MSHLSSRCPLTSLSFFTVSHQLGYNPPYLSSQLKIKGSREQVIKETRTLLLTFTCSLKPTHHYGMALWFISSLILPLKLPQIHCATRPHTHIYTHPYVLYSIYTLIIHFRLSWGYTELFFFFFLNRNFCISEWVLWEDHQFGRILNTAENFCTSAFGETLERQKM